MALAEHPTKPVVLIEPFGAGGGPDLLARAMSRGLSGLWSQRVTVENVTGGGATAGPAMVANALADGLTLLINTGAQAYSAAFVASLAYDPLRDFIPVAPLTRQPYVLVAATSAAIHSVDQLIATAARRQLVFGSTGIGTATHVGVAKFNRAAGIKATHMPPGPRASNADVIADAIAGRIAYLLAPISLALPGLQHGALIALAVSTAARSRLLPNVPTIAESGVAGFDFPIWYGSWVRAGTPTDIVGSLTQDISRVLVGAHLLKWMAEHGCEPMRMSQPEFAGFVQSESDSAASLMVAQ